MSAALTQTGNDPCSDAWRDALLHQQIAVLGDLAQAGLTLAKDIQRRSGEMEPGQMVPPIALGHASIAFAHVSRAVRLSIMLQARLAAKIPFPEPAARPKTDGDPTPSPGPEANLPDRERLIQESADHLDDDHFEEILTRPVGEVITLICTDLGIDPDDPRLTKSSPAGGGGPDAAQRSLVEGETSASPALGSSLPAGRDDKRPLHRVPRSPSPCGGGFEVSIPVPS